MKRRDFLTSAALLSLFAGEALAAPKPAAASRKKPIVRSKPKKKPVARQRNVRSSGNQAVATRGPVTHSADSPLIDNPPQGTTASRLPPVKAPELPSEWRTYEIVTHINVGPSNAPVRAWLPLPFSQDTLYQRTLGHSWQGNTSNIGMHRQPDGELEVMHCEWKEGSDVSLRLVTHVMTADRHFDISRRTMPPDRDDILRRNLQSTRLIPNDGLAQQLGERIVGRIKDPVAQGKAIYDWVVDNTIYDPALPGSGTGNVHKQLISANYGGRSADINGLFVAICRGIGIPARLVYGLRTGGSRLFRSLGLSTDDASQAHHVRAEFYIPGYGWIPVDPSDVRRAIAFEGLSDQDSRLNSLRRVLFGVWEMNWIAFNVGSNVRLPEHGETVPFLLLPQIQLGGKKLENAGTRTLPYRISARQVEL